MKAAEYAFWRRQPTHAVMTAVSELSAELYAMKGVHVSRLQKTLRVVRRPEPESVKPRTRKKRPSTKPR
jgi:hypothetical protein